MRASNTQPAITLRFEARTRPEAAEYMQRFERLLAQHPEVELEKLNDQIQAFSRPE